MTLNKSLRIKLLGVAALAFALTCSLQAQTVPGKAEVRALKGVAVYSTGGGPSMPLKVGTVLGPGSTVKTGAGSSVDLFLGNSAGIVRLTENTTLSIDKLTLTDTGADTAVEVQLNLPDGTMLGNVNKLSAASRYEIKTPNGVAGIRGTKFRMGANGFIVLTEGTMVFVYVPGGNQNPTPYTLAAPPPVYFSPTAGVQPAPQDLVTEVKSQFGGGPPFTPPGPPSGVPFREPFVSPGLGKGTVGSPPK